MAEPYHRTQRGWIIFAVALLPTIAIAALVATQGIPWMAAFMLFIAGAIALSFGWLTVSVDDDAVAIQFGIGLVRRTIPVSTIREARLGEAPALSGLGARWLGGKDWLYNVAPGPVVQLALDDGRQVLIGTEEPEELLAAIDARRPTDHRHAVVSVPGSDRSPLLVPAIMMLIFAGVGVVLYRSSRPSTIALDATALTVSGAGFTSRTALHEIRSVELLEAMPAMDSRANGFAFSGHRRGTFVSSELGGKGNVFTDRDRAPYLLVRTAEGFVLLNAPSPDSTRALAKRLKGGG